ncbi:hypothetical protein KY285_007491 [Solanum tuberosum]|nr:hypothetical protein KY285_007491 [Solanum tuberosum]
MRRDSIDLLKKNEDKAFQVKEATTKYGENNGPASRGRGRGDFVVVEVVAMEEADEGMMGICSTMSKVTKRMAFNVIIVSTTGI